MSVLSLQVLSLNKTYQPIGLISVKDAIESVFAERAEIIEQEENGSFSSYCAKSWHELSEMKRMLIEEGEDLESEFWINRTSPSFIAPKVIRYFSYDKSFIKKVKFSRRNIMLRDNYTCIYCNQKFPIENLQLEHIVPKSQGGKSTWKNTACACSFCNTKKADRTPEQAGMKMHWKPFIPSFLPKQKIKKNNHHYKFWEQFLSDMYWNVSLEE